METCLECKPRSPVLGSKRRVVDGLTGSVTELSNKYIHNSSLPPGLIAVRGDGDFAN